MYIYMLKARISFKKEHIIFVFLGKCLGSRIWHMFSRSTDRSCSVIPNVHL